MSLTATLLLTANEFDFLACGYRYLPPLKWLLV